MRRAETAKLLKRHDVARNYAFFHKMAQDVHPSGAAGDASLATAEKGKATAELQAKGFVELLADVARFPLAKLHKAN